MKNMLMMGSMAALSLGLMVTAACSDDDGDTTTTTTSANGGSGGTGGSGGSGAQGGGGSGGGVPEIPTLGAQIDRKGRPAINTATTATFTDNATRNAAEAAYNANDDPSTWAAAYQPDVAVQLGIYDGLDEDCGNQPFYDTLGNAGYGTLSTVVANDWLTLYSGETTCGYLGVELDILAGAATPTSCGGRTLAEDVMDTTYFLVSGAAGFGDTVDEPAAAPSDAFPYLADADAN